MGLIDKLKTYINDSRVLKNVLLYRFFQWLPDSIYIRLQYRIFIGKSLRLNNPQTFNEKLQWLKLHDHNPLYPLLCDKIESKKWVEGKIGREYIIPTLGEWERAEDVDFDSLPDKFVIKTNHDSGRVIICKDKSTLDRKEVTKQLTKSLKRDYYKTSKEWPYKNVKRRILAEQFLETDDPFGVNDYKFMCFDGRVKYCFVCSERKSGAGLRVTFFDRKWNRMPFIRHYPASEKELPRPKRLDEMIRLAEILSKGIKFVRVDLYNEADNIYFGEMTFYPGSGYEKFIPEEWDLRFGDLIKLDN